MLFAFSRNRNEYQGLLNNTDDDRRSCRMPHPQVSMGTPHRHIIINNGLNPFIDVLAKTPMFKVVAYECCSYDLLDCVQCNNGSLTTCHEVMPRLKFP